MVLPGFLILFSTPMMTADRFLLGVGLVLYGVAASRTDWNDVEVAKDMVRMYADRLVYGDDPTGIEAMDAPEPHALQRRPKRR